MNREEEIDEVIQLWKEQSYQLGLKYFKSKTFYAAEKCVIIKYFEDTPKLQQKRLHKLLFKLQSMEAMV